MYRVTDEMIRIAVARVTNVKLGCFDVLCFIRPFFRSMSLQFKCEVEGVYLWSDDDHRYFLLDGNHERLFWKLIVNHVLFSEGDAPA